MGAAIIMLEDNKRAGVASGGGASNIGPRGSAPYSLSPRSELYKRPIVSAYEPSRAHNDHGIARKQSAVPVVATTASITGFDLSP